MSDRRSGAAQRVLFLPCLAEPQRAKRRRRRRRPRRLPSCTPCSRARAFPSQNAQGGQDAACRRPQPHGAAASRDSEHVGHPPVIAGRRRVRGNQAARSPHGRRRHGARGFGATCRVDGCGETGWQRGGDCAGRALVVRVSMEPGFTGPSRKRAASSSRHPRCVRGAPVQGAPKGAPRSGARPQASPRRGRGAGETCRGAAPHMQSPDRLRPPSVGVSGAFRLPK